MNNQICRQMSVHWRDKSRGWSRMNMKGFVRRGSQGRPLPADPRMSRVWQPWGTLGKSNLAEWMKVQVSQAGGLDLEMSIVEAGGVDARKVKGGEGKLKKFSQLLYSKYCLKNFIETNIFNTCNDSLSKCCCSPYFNDEGTERSSFTCYRWDLNPLLQLDYSNGL